MELIAVIMAADDSKARVKDATALLNYGFGKCRKYEEEKTAAIKPVSVKRGVEEQVEAAQKEPFTYIDTTGADLSAIERKVSMKKSLKAPIKKGQKAGEAKYYLNGTEIGSIDILTTESIAQASCKSVMLEVIKKLLL